MIPFSPDPPPAGMSQTDAEWIQRQLRRVAELSAQSVSITNNQTTVIGENDSRISANEANIASNTGRITTNEGNISGNTGRIVTLEQHPPRTDNPHGTSWTNLIGKPSCPVNWAKAWASDQTYQACDMVRDGAWTMIANKATTERPAPQPQGSPFWVSDVPGTPAWVLQSATTSSLIVGQRYTWDFDGYLLAVRMDRAEVSPAIEQDLWVVIDPLGTPEAIKLAGPIVPDATGWITFPQGSIFVLAGTAFDVFMSVRTLAVPTMWSGNWDYYTQNINPLDGEISHQSPGGGKTMLCAHVDSNSVDRSTALNALQVGDDIAGVGLNWRITNIISGASYIEFDVDPASRGSNQMGAQFDFTTYAPQPIAYNRADNHFASESQVQGFYSESGYENIVLDNHAYGVDIEIQHAVISDDWDLIAHSE